MGRWSEHHDQRKGQWFVNYVRFVMNARDNEGRVLFNMDNETFDRLMEEYYTKSVPSGWPTKAEEEEHSAKVLKSVLGDDEDFINKVLRHNREVTKE